MHIQSILASRLENYENKGLLRKLLSQKGMIDFWSNDYLGLAKSPDLWQKFQKSLNQYPYPTLGSTGSRLISGNYPLAEELEQYIAHYHKAEAGLLFSSGYAANHGLLSSLARKEDTLITDELVHASMIDGARLSKAKRLIFQHNNLEDLRHKLKMAQGTIFVAIESVYSMDGDIAPLAEIVSLIKEYGAHLIVDEAHATGVYGSKGAGIVTELGLESQILARVHTFGKALGAHGAIVVGSDILKKYLINFARPFIFTTGLPLINLLAIKEAYHFLEKNPKLTHQLHTNIAYFKQKMVEVGNWIPSDSPIQSLSVPGNEQAKTMAAHLQKAGIKVKAILSPTVPEGSERLRFCVHAFNRISEMDYLQELLQIGILRGTRHDTKAALGVDCL